MRVLVTGGAGYLGSVFVGKLLDDGHEVTVVDSFMYGQTSLNQYCSYDNFEVIVGDVRQFHLYKDELKKADVVIPLAALVGAPLCDKDPSLAWEVNTQAIQEALRCLSPSQIVIYPNTNSGYGIGSKQKECDEETSLKPISTYGKSKVETERTVLGWGGVAFRLATVFGMSPRMRLDLLVNNFVYRALNDRFVVLFESHFKRNYIHVQDVAHAFLHAIDNYDMMKGKAYNVGLSDANLSKMELCEAIHKHIRFSIIEAEVGEDLDKRDYIVSNKRIEATGFLPSVSLDQGIKELLKGLPMIRNRIYGNI